MKVVGSQMIVDHFDETRYVDGVDTVTYKMYLVGQHEWNEVPEEKFIH